MLAFGDPHEFRSQLDGFEILRGVILGFSEEARTRSFNVYWPLKFVHGKTRAQFHTKYISHIPTDSPEEVLIFF